MTTYDYRLIQKPSEDDLKALGAAGWRVIQSGTDPRDGVLAWVLMECVQTEAHVLSTPDKREVPEKRPKPYGSTALSRGSRKS